MMKLTERQEKLLQFVKECHSGQVRKYNGEEYWNHPYRVAEMCVHLPFGIEIAFGHDLFEDTECVPNTLFSFLESVGYDYSECANVVSGVSDLTDQYTREKYPKSNRAARKELESARLGGINHVSQSIKYADFLDNTKSIIEHDRSFAKVYLREQKMTLAHMRDGDINLLIECCYSLRIAELLI